MVIDGGTGEILGRGGAYMYEFEEVDKERFVKLFLDGVRKTAGLSTTGLMIFELIYHQVRENPNNDEIKMSLMVAQDRLPNLAERTYRRGLRELLDKEVIFRSPVEGVFLRQHPVHVQRRPAGLREGLPSQGFGLSARVAARRAERRRGGGMSIRVLTDARRCCRRGL